ncbi:tRNA (guanine) methyltransferase [Yamadazyma tenuis]|uniref:tRNA/rRNA methyltransferase SpoU type domain-containing protein n=1 Tax=Candida tenuis (strain ATCC 10573 / BCRC 21748 / CBS 615 / JCM 9827 / NBRC 10315 / NRRL Y-1498 / VKM Y-70) TaxID=590646 RepID=G3B6P9_CANTC|nr:uncharacterized protein CANTEDRAFT_134828 [Yamadazyma tenuis ATCC 10573]EGV62985.1 hypothetical protein CANTEDRAFT_134828 [Yamadazyma tenuis ATCC 10573]WEJ97194.1 tRNA (guanine) methyltransferase [Yamadazyma tenuis]
MSLSLVSRFLDPQKVAAIGVELAQNIGESPESIPGLCDLLDQIEDKAPVISIVSPFVENVISSVHEEQYLKNMIQMCGKLPQLYELAICQIKRALSAHIKHSMNKFVPGIKAILESSEIVSHKGEALEQDYIVYLLKVLELVFAQTSFETDFKVDQILCFLVAIDVEEINAQALKTFKWRIDTITRKTLGTDFLWNIIFLLIQTKSNYHCTNAYIVWLRYLNNSNANFTSDTFYQSVILSNSKYFDYLQGGLTSELHEHRKLCFSILKLSILQINADIHNSIFEFKIDEKSLYMKEWERFFTVFEIVAIDTSLHQTEAASGDIISLISPDSSIHPSWGFSLLSTGFRAGNDSVRKFTLNLLYSIPSSNLFLIKHALPVLETIFLPYMMLANHLIVVEDQCSYGDIMCDFIADIIQSCNTEEESRVLVNTFLKVLSNVKDAFDPSKIYVLLGIYKGLQGKQILEFSEAGEKLVSLFEIASEGFLFHKTLQTITLRLVLSFKFEVSSFLKAMERFIRFNGSALVNENFEDIKKYLLQNMASPDDFKLDFASDFVNAVSLYFRSVLGSQFEYIDRTKVVANLIGSSLDLHSFESAQFKQYLNVHLEKLVNEPQDPDIYQVLARSSSIPNTLELSSLWNSVQEDVESNDEEVLRVSVVKYKFLNSLVNDTNLKAFDLGSLVSFKKRMFVNSKTASINSKDFYKVKEDMVGQFLRTLEILTTKKVFKSGDIDAILTIIPSNLVSYQSNISVVSFLAVLLDSNISKDQISGISDVLLEVWNNLTSTRLQLNQKDLHKAIIQALLHPKIIDMALEVPSLSDSLVAFCSSVIENAVGRRGLLPTLAKCISDYQVYHHENFSRSYWLCKTLVDGLVMYQLSSNAFKLESVIGRLFDENFGQDGSDLYLDIYNVHEVSSEVNFMAIYSSIKSSDFASQLLEFIVENQKSYNLFEVVRCNDGYEQWTRIRVFTIIACIITKVNNTNLLEYLQQFIKLLDSDPSPLVRIYIEWIVALKLGDYTDLQDQLFTDLRGLLDLKEMKPSLICSYQRVLVLFINHLPLEKQQQYLERLLLIVIPCATSNKATVRHFSTSLICTVYPMMEEKHIQVAPELSQVLTNMYESALSNTILGAYRNGDALLWDMEKDHTLVNLAGVLLLRVSHHDVEFISEAQYKRYLTSDQIGYLNIPIGKDCEDLWIKDRKKSLAKPTFGINKHEMLNKNPLQTKSGAWSTVMDLDDSDKNTLVKRSDLIVVSSLVDKPPNLGGICRLCDVLGAGLLTLHDISIKDHNEFRNVAVTADHWMPMIEVAVPDIVKFLRQKKKEGYTLIGLEQTDNSVELNSDLKFPQKSLILLGKEREGVPGELLAELDLCVEIKQVGVIRSMNIQTATAIIVQAYSSQHC